MPVLASACPPPSPALAARSPAEPRRADAAPRVSVVIPVYNEEEMIDALWQRLRPVLEEIPGGAEAIFTDDGSSDATLERLRALCAVDGRITVLSFNRNYGQHAAVLAGVARARGEVVVTMDADLQDPPEEIPRLVAKLDEGYDVVGGVRERRRTHALRRAASWLNNRAMARAVGLDIHDFGCMLRAYRRSVIDAMLRCPERSIFLPGLAARFARRSAEVPVAHRERAAGASKYSWRKLLRLQADLVMGFASVSLWPLCLAGLALAGLSGALLVAVVVARLAAQASWLAAPTLGLAAAVGVFNGVMLAMVGFVGEHVSRIHDEVRRRPRSVVHEVFGPGLRSEGSSPLRADRAPGEDARSAT